MQKIYKTQKNLKTSMRTKSQKQQNTVTRNDNHSYPTVMEANWGYKPKKTQ